MNGHTAHSVTPQNSSRTALSRDAAALGSIRLSQVSISGLADANSNRNTQLKSSGTTQTVKDLASATTGGLCDIHENAERADQQQILHRFIAREQFIHQRIAQ